MLAVDNTISHSVEGPEIWIIYSGLTLFFATGFFFIPAWGIVRSLRRRDFGWTVAIVLTIPMFFGWIATFIYVAISNRREGG